MARGVVWGAGCARVSSSRRWGASRRKAVWWRKIACLAIRAVRAKGAGGLISFAGLVCACAVRAVNATRARCSGECAFV